MSQPEHLGVLLARYERVFQVAKRCDRCGAEWIGNSFHPAESGPSPRPATCDACLETEDAAWRERQQVQRKAAEDVELIRMREPGE